MATNNKVFTLKTFGAQLYKWSPSSNEKNKPNNSNNGSNNRPFYCNALPGSQGQDWVTTYVYDLVVVDNQQEHEAYVSCDYAE